MSKNVITSPIFRNVALTAAERLERSAPLARIAMGRPQDRPTPCAAAHDGEAIAENIGLAMERGR